MKIDIGILTCNRYEILSKNLNKLLEKKNLFSKIILVDNGSNQDCVKKLKKNFSSFVQIDIIFNEKNLGVSARNIIFKKSNADLLVCIDDDAIINNIQESFVRLKKIFLKINNLGILNFKIIDSTLQKVIKREFPQTKYELLKFNKILKISYFIGAGFAIKKEVFKKFKFNEKFFYAQEEIDISYRIIDQGYLMMFDPKITLIHYRDNNARLSTKKVYELNLKHRMIINFRYLPLKHLIVSNILWTIKTFVSTLSFNVILDSYLYYLNEKKKYKRTVISNSTIKYIKETNGRLYY